MCPARRPLAVRPAHARAAADGAQLRGCASDGLIRAFDRSRLDDCIFPVHCHALLNRGVVLALRSNCDSTRSPAFASLPGVRPCLTPKMLSLAARRRITRSPTTARSTSTSTPCPRSRRLHHRRNRPRARLASLRRSAPASTSSRRLRPTAIRPLRRLRRPSLPRPRRQSPRARPRTLSRPSLVSIRSTSSRARLRNGSSRGRRIVSMSRSVYF